MKEYNEMPDGWRVDHGATTAPRGYVTITNGKSRFAGERKSGIIKMDLVKEELQGGTDEITTQIKNLVT